LHEDADPRLACREWPAYRIVAVIQIPDARSIDINSLVRLRKHLSWAGPWVGALALVGYVPFSTLELRMIQDHLSPFGPLVAIGRPEEPLSPLGAGRDYVPDSDWQDEVRQRIQAAAIVVLIIGTSQGLAWELARLRDLAQLHKLILLFPPAADVVNRWATLVGRDQASGLPILPGEIRPEATLALIYADDLTPLVIEAKRDAWSYETPCGSEGCSRLQPASNRRPVADNVFAHARSPRPLVARAFGPANGRPGSPEGLRYD